MKKTTLADERMKLAIRSREPFTYRGTMYVPLKTMDDALTEAAEFFPAKYKADFRIFYDGDKNQSPRQEFIDYFYSYGDENLEKAVGILADAYDSFVSVHSEINNKINVERAKQILERIKNKC